MTLKDYQTKLMRMTEAFPSLGIESLGNFVSEVSCAAYFLGSHTFYIPDNALGSLHAAEEGKRLADEFEGLRRKASDELDRLEEIQRCQEGIAYCEDLASKMGTPEKAEEYRTRAEKTRQLLAKLETKLSWGGAEVSVAWLEKRAEAMDTEAEAETIRALIACNTQ